NDVEEWARLYVRGRILYMVWHADEQAVHAHIFAVPVLPEPKPTSPTVDGDAAGSPAALPTRAKSWGNLASSKILTREYLWRLHDTFQEEVGSHYGLARAIKGSRATPYELRAHAVEVKKQ